MLILAVLLLLTVAVLAWRLRQARRRTRAATRRLAMATGHPSAGAATGAGWADRRELADEAAHELAALGLIAERRTSAPIVYAQGAAGHYALTVAGGGRVLVEYNVTGEGVIDLGEFGGIYAAVREIGRHAEIPAPA